MKIVIYVSDSSDPRFNLAAEEIMFDRTVPGQVTLFLWQNERTVVIGKSQNAWNEARVEKLRSDGGVLVRRPSGGGAVYHDLGNMCYTFVCSPELYSLPRQLKVILNAVKACGIDAEFTGRNDIVTPDGRKFSGNAFRFSGSAALMHGTLLIHTDFSRMSEYLSVPKAKIEAKGVSSVRSRVANLSEINPEITVERVKTDMIRAFLDEYQPGNVGPDGSRNTTAADAFPVLSVCEKELLSGSGNVFFSELPEKYSKYDSWEWTYGSTPRFNFENEKKFDWGLVRTELFVENGTICSAAVYSDAMDADLGQLFSGALSGTRFDRISVSEKAVAAAAALSAGGYAIADTSKVAADIVSLLFGD